MKRVFEFVCQNGKLFSLIFIIAILSSCSVSSDICAAYAFNDPVSNKDYTLD